MLSTRIARPEDAAAVTALVHAAYRRYVERIGREPAPMSADYPALISAGAVWVAEAEGTPVGVLVLHERPDHLVIENIAVCPAAQGRGIGRRLLALADDEARTRGLARIGLYTNEAMTENLAYYPRHGYVETHRAVEHGFRRVYFTRKLG